MENPPSENTTARRSNLLNWGCSAICFLALSIPAQGSFSPVIPDHYSSENLFLYSFSKVSLESPQTYTNKSEIDFRLGYPIDSVDCSKVQTSMQCMPQVQPEISESGKIKLTLLDIVPNANPCGKHYKVKVANQWGTVFWEAENISGQDSILNNLNLCTRIGERLAVFVENSLVKCSGSIRILNYPRARMTSGFRIGQKLNQLPTYRISQGKLDTYLGFVPPPEDHIPKVEVFCYDGLGLGYTGLKARPDISIGRPCDMKTDTAEVIYRTWEVYNNSGLLTTLVDTIVVFRWPPLRIETMVGRRDQVIFSDLDTSLIENEALKTYYSIKQILSRNDDNLPILDEDQLIYRLYNNIITHTYEASKNDGFEKEYLSVVIVKRNSSQGKDITIGDILRGTYAQTVLDEATLTELQEYFVEGPLGSYLPFLFLNLNDEVLASDGRFDRVTSDWYEGGDRIYWFSGGWPQIQGSGDLVRYYDQVEPFQTNCHTQIYFPDLNQRSSSTCIPICLDQVLEKMTGDITFQRQITIADQSCPRNITHTTTLTQSCWAKGDFVGQFSGCQWSGFNESSFLKGELYVQPESNAESDPFLKTFQLKKQWTVEDTIGPIFQFDYPMDNGQLLSSCEEECSVSNWNHEARWRKLTDQNEEIINEATYQDLSQAEQSSYHRYPSEIHSYLLKGQQPPAAKDWERCHPSIYSMDSMGCYGWVFLPSVTLSEAQSGIRSVVAQVGDTTVNLYPLQTMNEYSYAYVHQGEPLKIPAKGPKSTVEVRYVAVDSCFNQSIWVKYIVLEDQIPPVITPSESWVYELEQSQTWVETSKFEAKAQDNCGMALVLGRRRDWWIHTQHFNFRVPSSELSDLQNFVTYLGFRSVEPALHGIDLCGSYDFDFEALSKIVSKESVGYLSELKAMYQDYPALGERVFHAWIYDMVKIILSVQPTQFGRTFNSISIESFELFLDHLMGVPGYGKSLSYLGGGWSRLLPFDCGDICRNVIMELLVMDHNGNWTTATQSIRVTDNFPLNVVRTLPDLTLSSLTYQKYYKDKVEALQQISTNSNTPLRDSVYAEIDQALGGFQWVSGQHEDNWVDDQGTRIEDRKLQFILQHQSCASIDKIESEIVNNEKADTLEMGIVQSACAAIRMDQKIESFVSDCDVGYLLRTLTLRKQCTDTLIERTWQQTITIESDCHFDSTLIHWTNFEENLDSIFCVTQLDRAGQELTPSRIGRPIPLADLSQSRTQKIQIDLIGNDKVVTLQDNKYRLERTWQVVDSCSGETLILTQLVVFHVDELCNPETNSINLTGQIRTADHRPIDHVSVLGASDFNFRVESETDAQGWYGLEANGMEKLTIRPFRDDFHGNGVSTIDVIAIQRYVLRRNDFSSIYQHIAADVYPDNQINGIDILSTRRMVLNPNGRFSNNTSWRFFSEDGLMHEEVVVFRKDLPLNINFIGVKVGDVNGDNHPHKTSRRTVYFSMQDQELKKNSTYSIPVRVKQDLNILGCQCTFVYPSDRINNIDVHSGKFPLLAEHVHRLRPGVITFSWSQATPLTLKSEEALFHFSFQPQDNLSLGQSIAFSDEWINCEIYDAQLNTHSLGLQYDRSSTSQVLLYQNHPNPGHDYTNIGFDLPKAALVNLRIWNTRGQLLWQQKQSFEAGSHQMRIYAKDLNTSGVMYYQLSTAEFSQTRKMIWLD